MRDLAAAAHRDLSKMHDQFHEGIGRDDIQQTNKQVKEEEGLQVRAGEKSRGDGWAVGVRLGLNLTTHGLAWLVGGWRWMLSLCRRTRRT